MEDFDLERLESRLRRSVSVRYVDPPAGLFEFAEAVPSRHGRRSVLRLPFSALSVRRLYRLTTTAIAIVVAVAATAVIVNARHHGAGSGSSNPAYLLWDPSAGAWQVEYLETPSAMASTEPTASATASDEPTALASASQGPNATTAPVPSPSSNGCVGSLPVVENVDGLSGWRVAYVANASSVAGVCTGVSGALGSEMAVYATCSASKTLHVELSDADPSLAAGGPLATFDVDCAASPVLVYRSAGDPKLVGHFVQIFLVDPPEGDYQFLVQTTDGPLPSPAPALTP
jgi:hypothetical protein